jgi:hypothetical protein
LLQLQSAVAGQSCNDSDRVVTVLMMTTMTVLLLPSTLRLSAGAGSIRRDNQQYEGIALCEQARATLQVTAAAARALESLSVDDFGCPCSQL